MSQKKREKGKKKSINIYTIIWFIVVICIFILILNYEDVFLVSHKPLGFNYIAPTDTAMFASFGLLIISFIIATYQCFASKKDSSKDRIKRVAKKLSICFALLIVAGVLCYNSFYYLDENGYNKKTIFATEEVFINEDVEKVNVYVGNAASSPTGGTIYNNYYIGCEFYVGDDTYVLDSGFFYNYSNMYDYLLKFTDKIEYDKSRLNELLEFERNRPINYSAERLNEKIEYINKIFSLSNVVVDE